MPSAASGPAALLGAAALAAAAACGSATDPTPASVTPGRFVLTSAGGGSLPAIMQRGAQYSVTLLADTLWLAADGTAQQAQATSSFSTDPSRAGTSTDVARTVGTWAASGAQVRVTAIATFPTGASGADTLVVTPRGEGALADGGWVWQRR